MSNDRFKNEGELFSDDRRPYTYIAVYIYIYIYLYISVYLYIYRIAWFCVQEKIGPPDSHPVPSSTLSIKDYDCHIFVL
jgi:hypothetical protein